jgi:glycine cleavage system aminomethyltransferase T
MQTDTCYDGSDQDSMTTNDLDPVSMINHATNYLFTVPFDRDPKFIGRANALQQIKAQHKLRRRVALAGIGGVGSVLDTDPLPLY